MSSLNLDGANAELARRDLTAFCKRMEPAFTAPPHIKLLVDLLTQLENPSSGLNRLCVSLPPRFGKTTLCSQLFPAWAIGRDSRRSVILANHSSELATGFSRKCKQHVESPAWPFPRIEMSEDSRATHRWNVSPGGGGLFSVGIGSGLTGVGMDLGIVDDPINDGLSEVEREQAWAWFREVFFPRQNANAKLLVVSARLAVTDIPGLLAEAPDAHEWRFVSLPAINEDGNELGLEPGAPLWDRFDLKALSERREAMGLAAYESQYLQNPSVAGGGKIFRIGDFPTYEILPQAPVKAWEPLDIYYTDPLKAAWAPDDSFVKVTGVDLAGVANSSAGGSYHALVSILYNTLDGCIYVIDCERARNLTREDLVSFVRRHLDRNNPDLTVLEEASSGGYVGGLLSRTTRYPLRMVQPKTSKEERALQIIGLIEGGKVHLPLRSTWGDMLRAEIADFPGRYSDMVDSLVWALLYCRQLAAARREDSFYARQLEGFSLFGR